MCVCVFFFGGEGGGEWVRELGEERQEKREKWGKFRNNGQYFVIEKKDKGGKSRKEGAGFEIARYRGGSSLPPPPPAPLPFPITVECFWLFSIITSSQLDLFTHLPYH